MTSFKDISGTTQITTLCDPPSEHYNLNKLLCTAVYSRAMEGSRLYTPFIVPRRELKEYKNPPRKDKIDTFPIFRPLAINGMILFPFEGQYTHEDTYTLNKNSLYKITDVSPFSGKSIRVDNFDVSKIDHIQGFVEDHGSLYITISNIKGMLEFIDGGIEKLECAYKYSVNTKNYLVSDQQPLKEKPRDLLTLVIAFHNLRYSTPIYDFKHINGMAVSIYLCWPQSAICSLQPLHKLKSDLILTNYANNILEVDGQLLCMPKAVAPALLAEARQIVNAEHTRRGNIPKFVRAFEKSKRGGTRCHTNVADSVKVDAFKTNIKPSNNYMTFNVSATINTFNDIEIYSDTSS